MTEINPPTYLQNGCYTAEQVRQLNNSIVCEEGVCDFAGGDLLVSDGASGMDVSVAAGCAWVQGDESSSQGIYYVTNDGAVTLTHDAPHSTDDRIDIIVARVNDSQYSGSEDTWELDIVVGATHPSSPTAPTPGNNELLLAEVYINSIANGGGTVVPGDITDQREEYLLCAENIHVQPAAVITRAANQSIPNNTETIVDFTAVESTQGNITADDVGNRITIDEDGFYIISATGAMTGASGGIRRLVIRDSGSATLGWQSDSGTANNGTRAVTATVGKFLTSGDFIQVTYFQNSGSAQDLQPFGDTPRLSVVKVG